MRVPEGLLHTSVSQVKCGSCSKLESTYTHLHRLLWVKAHVHAQGMAPLDEVQNPHTQAVLIIPTRQKGHQAPVR
jgi:hypothetical protein